MQHRVCTLARKNSSLLLIDDAVATAPCFVLEGRRGQPQATETPTRHAENSERRPVRMTQSSEQHTDWSKRPTSRTADGRRGVVASRWRRHLATVSEPPARLAPFRPTLRLPGGRWLFFF